MTRLFSFFWALLPICFISSSYLYFYPIVNRCEFFKPSQNVDAPFRLLAFGDPQLEGDTSLPPRPFTPLADLPALINTFRDRDIAQATINVQQFFRYWLQLAKYYVKCAHKQLDLIGNDFYLAHIYRTLHWWIEPTHVTVLGDLLGSQWIDDAEFERRSSRFWNRVFTGASRVPDGRIDPRSEGGYSPRIELLGEDEGWSRRLINVPGNHDIGYAGDTDEGRIARFERAFGPIHGDIFFQLPKNATALVHETDAVSPGVRVVVLNTMNLDSPAWKHELQTDTYGRINEVMAHSEPVETHSTITILLTHIPLHKAPGICVDSPMFTYYGEHQGGGIKEQNLLSEDKSRDAILQGIFGFHSSAEAEGRGMGRDGIILTGHDHEGCDVYHYANRETGDWLAKKWSDQETMSIVEQGDVPGVREVTVRSMMGEFGGNAALLSAWWDEDHGRWAIGVSNCSMGVQHIWWAVHSLNAMTFFLLLLGVLTSIFNGRPGMPGRTTPIANRIKTVPISTKPGNDRLPDNTANAVAKYTT
jgi:hypothetical protein